MDDEYKIGDLIRFEGKDLQEDFRGKEAIIIKLGLGGEHPYRVRIIDSHSTINTKRDHMRLVESRNGLLQCGEQVELDDGQEGIIKKYDADDGTYLIRLDNEDERWYHIESARTIQDGPRVRGVRYQEALEDLIYEKFAILGRHPARIKPGGFLPSTDGEYISLPGRIRDVPYERESEESPKDDPNMTLYVGELLREAAQIRYGSFLADFSGYIHNEFNNTNLIKHLLNLVEDVRVDEAFKREHKGDSHHIIPFVQTALQLTKTRKRSEDMQKIQVFLSILDDMALTGMSYDQLNMDAASEEQLLQSSDGILKSNGINTYEDFLRKSLSLIEQARHPEATVLDSMKISREVYTLFEESFGETARELEPLRSRLHEEREFDSGPISIKTTEELSDEEKRRQLEKEYQKLQEEINNS